MRAGRQKAARAAIALCGVAVALSPAGAGAATPPPSLLASLARYRANTSAPSWSPDGLMAVVGSRQRGLTRNAEWDGFPSWSPDGRRITFLRWCDGKAEVWVMRADGARQRRLVGA